VPHQDQGERDKPVELSVPVSAVLPALDSNALAVQMMEKKLRATVPEGVKFSLMIVAHGPNADDDATKWLEHLDRIASQLACSLPIRDFQCLLVRDDAEPAVRIHAVSDIKRLASEMAETGRTYVLTSLIARGHLSKEIEQLIAGSGCEFVDFCYTDSPDLPLYLENRIEEYMRGR